MKCSKSLAVILSTAVILGTLAGCSKGSSSTGTSGSSASASTSSQTVAFIPKITGNMYFESGNAGAQEMAKKVGFKVNYDGNPTAAVANQVQIINSEVNQGATALCIASLSPNGLNQALMQAKKKGVKIVTWDSDVDPQNRSIYVNQGTPELLGKMLVDMAYDELPAAKKDTAKIAFFYSSPTVTDQNSWVEYAKKYITEKHPKWQLLTTQYGEQDAQKSLQVGQSIINTYPDIDAVLCPDSTALPAMAQAAENLGKAGKIQITGFSTPSSMKNFVKDGTVKEFGLWDVKTMGGIAVYVSYWLAAGHQLNVGDSVDVPGVGKLTVQPNSIQGYSYTAKDSGIILMPERVVFTKDNIDKYNF